MTSPVLIRKTTGVLLLRLTVRVAITCDEAEFSVDSN